MLYKTKKGKWKLKKIPKTLNAVYAQSLENYFNCLDPLFIKAKKASEFEFMITLLDIKGTQDAGWEPFETTQEIFKMMNELKNKVRYRDEQLYIFLLLYGLIIEASFLYELLANLLNVAGGQRYKFNFPDKKIRNLPQSPSEKIQQLIQKAKAINLEAAINPIKEIFDQDLRNAVFHSDYTIYGEELRLPRNSKIYKINEIHELINKSLAYYETIINLHKLHKANYKKSKIINVHPDFSSDPEEKAVVMVRKGTGVIGLKDNWTEAQIKQGKIPFRLERLLPYELKMIDSDPYLSEFPPNKIEKINKILKLFPIPIRKHLLKFSKRFL